jgi:hypothetical protein
MRGVVELARSHSPEAIRTFQGMRNDEASPTARVAAANAILDRGNGKPKETVDANVRTSWEIWRSPQWEGRASGLHSRARRSLTSRQQSRNPKKWVSPSVTLAYGSAGNQDFPVIVR